MTLVYFQLALLKREPGESAEGESYEKILRCCSLVLMSSCQKKGGHIMKIHISLTFISVLMILFFVCAAHAGEETHVSSLQEASLQTWQKADFSAKMSTAEDWISRSEASSAGQNLEAKSLAVVIHMDKAANAGGRRYAKKVKAFDEAQLAMNACNF